MIALYVTAIGVAFLVGFGCCGAIVLFLLFEHTRRAEAARARRRSCLHVLPGGQVADVYESQVWS